MNSSLFQRVAAVALLVLIILGVGLVFVTLLPLVLVIVALVWAVRFFRGRDSMQDPSAHKKYDPTSQKPLQNTEQIRDAVFTKKEDH
jgi:Na+-transporting methylmalonyl-CoA/oxaloacetate decarboxylase gamma subunit